MIRRIRILLKKRFGKPNCGIRGHTGHRDNGSMFWGPSYFIACPECVELSTQKFIKDFKELFEKPK